MPESNPTPEIYLKQFNQYSIRLLASLFLLPDGEKKNQLINNFKVLLRRSYVSEQLFNRHVVAISGLQGAGKSTLIKQMYDIGENDYFPENLGRGEVIPILVTEHNGSFNTYSYRLLPTDQGDYEISRVEISKSEFEIRSTDPDPQVNDIILELKVPRKYQFPRNFSFLILPGFQGKMEIWQELLRTSLSASTTCVFVIDPDKSSDSNNKLLIEKIKRDFKETKPIFVVTHEDKSYDSNKEFCSQLAQSYIPENEGDRVISTGAFEANHASFGKWIGLFIKAIKKYSSISNVFRKAQLYSLELLVSEEFGLLLAEIESSIKNLKANQTDNDLAIQGELDFFDAAVKKLKEYYLRAYDKALERRLDRAIESLDEEYMDKSRWAKLKEWLDNRFGGSQDIAEIEAELLKIWIDALEYSGAEERLLVLDTVMSQGLGLYEGLPSIDGKMVTGKALVQSSFSGLQVSKKYSESSHVTSDDFQKDLSYLFCNSSSFDHVSKHFETSIKLIPIMALEIIRLVSSASVINGQISKGSSPNVNDALSTISREFESMKGNTSKIIMAFASFIGLDLIVDGKIESFPALIHGLEKLLTGPTVATAAPAASAGAAGAGAAAAGSSTAAMVAGCAAAFLAATYLASIVLTDAVKSSQEEHAMMRKALYNLKQNVMVQNDTNFSEMMSALRDILYERLRTKKGLTSNLAYIHRLDRSVALVREVRNDLCQAIARHPMSR